MKWEMEERQYSSAALLTPRRMVRPCNALANAHPLRCCFQSSDSDDNRTRDHLPITVDIKCENHVRNQCRIRQPTGVQSPQAFRGLAQEYCPLKICVQHPYRKRIYQCPRSMIGWRYFQIACPLFGKEGRGPDERGLALDSLAFSECCIHIFTQSAFGDMAVGKHLHLAGVTILNSQRRQHSLLVPPLSSVVQA